MAEPTSTPSQAAIAEIDHGPSKLDQFLDKHTSKLIIAAILIALGLVAYVIKSGIDKGKAQEAGAALISANTTDELKGVITKWSGSKAAASAMPLLASSQWEKDKGASLATLEKFTLENPKHPAIASAKVSLGIKLFNQGKKAEAIDTLTEAAENDSTSYIAPLAAITLGDIAKEDGDTTGATTWYEKAKEKTAEEGNAFAQIAEERLITVNAAAPKKIQPVKATSPTPPTPANQIASPAIPPVPVTPPAPATPPIPVTPPVPEIPSPEVAE